ncbi:hypothetical protein [Pseudotabrizicola sp. L79]|uniref:hypothetical protein n=1 Tax=Pseudotabrizicola sp. L79 TaxID=3118402 RepID=UPI002F938FEF
MPLPLAPLVPLALRLGVVAAVGYAAKRALAARTWPGRTDQRAEEALDDLAEGVTSHSPKDAPGQHNAGLRLRRTLRFRGKSYDLDAGLIARFRLKETE